MFMGERLFRPEDSKPKIKRSENWIRTDLKHLEKAGKLCII